MTEDELPSDSQGFEKQDERVFSFKQKIIKWLKEAEINKEEVGSRNSVRPRSLLKNGEPNFTPSDRNSQSLEVSVT